MMTEQNQRDLKQETAQFRQAHPDVEQLTDAVTQAWAAGKPLTRAWEEQQQSDAEPDEADRARQQNEAAAARAPVAGVTGQGGAQQPRTDSFLSGLEESGW